MFGKIGIYEQIMRYSIGAVLIELLITMHVPFWSAFIANYLVFTAMVQWDPVYALLAVIKQQLVKSTKPAAPAYASS